jgi:hypothetical protein
MTVKHTSKIAVLIIILISGIFNGLLHGEDSKFKFSFSERFRFVGWDNAINLNEDIDDGFAFTRHRTSLGMVWTPTKQLQLGIKLTNEFRNYLSPKNRDFNLHEVVFDQLYLKIKKIGKLPLSLTLGRQNIILGEGFVVLEGHPLDGSRTIYFNAVRGDYQFSKNHKLTAFYAYQPVTDNILPLINDREQSLVPYPYHGLGIYYTGKFKKNKIEAYFIHKLEETEADNSDNSKIETLGMRFSRPLGKQLSITAEYAFQFGSMEKFDRSGNGGYFHLDYNVGDTLPLLKTLTLGGIFLSGDDPNTEKIEGWDPVFSRWPKWSESYIYTLIRENGVAYWSNINSLYFSLLMDLTQKVNLKLTYHHLGSCFGSDSGGLYGGGKSRGDLFIGRMNMRINKNTTAHFIWEHFKPGDFYFQGADNSNWLRFEVMFAF